MPGGYLWNHWKCSDLGRAAAHLTEQCIQSGKCDDKRQASVCAIQLFNGAYVQQIIYYFIFPVDRSISCCGLDICWDMSCRVLTEKRISPDHLDHAHVRFNLATVHPSIAEHSLLHVPFCDIGHCN